MASTPTRDWILRGIGCVMTCWISAPPAQVTLPELDVKLPSAKLPASSLDPAGAGRLAAKVDARKLRVRARVRAHPDRLAVDPRGELVVRGELLAEPSNDAAMRAWADAGFRVLRQRSLADFGLDLYVLEPPAGRALDASLRRLRTLDPPGHYDFHHVLTDGGSADVGNVANDVATPASPARTVRVGLIDGGLAATHEAFAGVGLLVHGCGDERVPSTHGTAVGALLAESLGARANGGAQGVELVAADVYCGDATGGAVERVIDALGWMSQRQVPVINVSLVGPRNRVLERVIARVIARGHTIVAAVGNDGPAASPLFPAAYEGVVGVTAVDRRRRVLLEAGRGPHVDFAALGTDLQAATLPHGRASVRGTSFAAPQVAAMFARRLQRADPAAAAAAFEALAHEAIDLGARGRHPIYGLGWVEIPSPDGKSAAPGLLSKDRAQ
ncbi:MAG: peptidase [Steroidobacteraceae bacterium]|nr:peptidase [Steroidobacteraceae bacterium]